MRKYGPRILVGLVAFVIGISAVIWKLNQPIACDFVPTEKEQTEISIPTYPTSSEGKIELRFNGFGKLENRSSLKFAVINHNTKPATYWSFTEKNIWTFVKFNGKQKEELRCGTGMREFTLNSGDSFEIEFVADIQIYEFLKKDGFFEFGYYFNIDGKHNERKGKEYWSEPIKISDELKKEIIKNAPEFLKQHGYKLTKG